MKPSREDFEKALEQMQQFIRKIDLSKSRGFAIIWTQEDGKLAEKAVMKFGGMTDDLLAYLLWNEALESREHSQKSNAILTR